jgi:hypothetical protein
MARLEGFGALKFCKPESFRALKFSILEIEAYTYPDRAHELKNTQKMIPTRNENFRALKLSN